MKTLILLSLAFGFALANPCSSFITLLSKCAEFGMSFGQVQCGSLASRLHSELSLKVSPPVALTISDACYKACLLQSEFFKPGLVDELYKLCQEGFKNAY